MPASKSSFDMIFRDSHDPLTARGWALVGLVAAMSCAVIAVVAAHDSRGTAGILLFISGSVGLLFCCLAVHRELVVRTIHVLRRSSLGDRTRMAIFVVALWSLPVGLFGLLLLAS